MKEIIIPIGFALFILIGSIYSIRERLWFRKHGKLFDVRIISIDERVRYNTRGGKISTYILQVEFLDGEVCDGTVTYDLFGGWMLRVGMIVPVYYNRKQRLCHKITGKHLRSGTPYTKEERREFVKTTQLGESYGYNEDKLSNWENFRDPDKKCKYFGKASLVCGAVGLFLTWSFPLFLSVGAVVLAVLCFKSPKRADSASGVFMAGVGTVFAVVSVLLYSGVLKIF